MMLEIVLAASLIDAGFAATEAVATGDQMLLCPADPLEPSKSDVMLMLDFGASEFQFEQSKIGPCRSRYGPMSWGVSGNALYLVGTIEAPGAWLGCGIQPLSELIPLLRQNRETGRVDFDADRRIRAYSAEHGRQMDAIGRFIDSQRSIHGIRHDAWDLYIDLAYTALNHVTVIAVRQGQLRWWTWNKPEETNWVDRGTMETRIEGAFRIVQAGDDLYLVDSRGWVFSSPDQGARLLGTITGWGQPREGETLFLLEEQKHGKIAVVKVAEGKTTVLEALVEAEAREDFMTTIDDEDLDRAIIRMAAALREEERGGK